MEGSNKKELTEATEIAEHVVRTLLKKIENPEFGQGSVPVPIVAKIMGKDACWVRTGIDEGWLPIGISTHKTSKGNYYVSPKLLWELTGFIWKGEKG